MYPLLPVNIFLNIFTEKTAKNKYELPTQPFEVLEIAAER